MGAETISAIVGAILGAVLSGFVVVYLKRGDDTTDGKVRLAVQNEQMNQLQKTINILERDQQTMWKQFDKMRLEIVGIKSKVKVE